jgi:hypothetical protein
LISAVRRFGRGWSLPLLGIRERSPYPGLQLEAGQAFIQGRNESQVIDHVLFADFFNEHTAVSAVRDEIAEDVDGEVNAPGIASSAADSNPRPLIGPSRVVRSHRRRRM